jgi:hypothetical protein
VSAKWLFIACLTPLVAGAQSEPVAVRPPYTRPVIDSTEMAPTQDSAATPASTAPGCWRAQSRCSSFFLTDMGVEFPLHSTRLGEPTASGRRRSDFGTRLMWTFGVMGTKGRQSHGAAFSIASELSSSAFFPYTFEYRYRNWVTSTSALDGGLGYKTHEVWVDGVGAVKGHGMTAMLAFTPSRFIGVNARFDLIRARGTNHSAVLLGLQSTRLSEVMMRFVFVETIRAVLGRIGIELEDED